MAMVILRKGCGQSSKGSAGTRLWPPESVGNGAEDASASETAPRVSLASDLV